MHFTSKLTSAMLARRYKRFLADVVFDTGDMTTVHVANPGPMTGLDRPFSRVWLSDSGNQLRKFPLTWELVEADLGSGPELIGVNTTQPGQLVAEALAAGQIPELRDYASVRRQVKYGANSRIDFLLEDAAQAPCYVEVNNVHFMRRPRLAEFPDAVTDRGAAHLDELAALLTSGARALLLFIIQIASADRLAIARDIDPAYAEAFARARAKGVQALAWRCRLSEEGIDMAAPIPVEG
ncbi:MAG TPA: DNA/RNA nuclease SfsA [Xanthobacteraceae bacterium]|jgi:sugar fermentation stimulation protein A|nr:DNA/RNA nuclease SfsA [Xanthobacteraceae bacterium]